MKSKYVFSIFVLFVAVFMFFGIVVFPGCNGCKLIGKDIRSNFTGLDRTITVYDSMTKETLWYYSGNCYIDSDSGVGDVTIIYTSNNVPYKVDFLGNFISVIAIEQ